MGWSRSAASRASPAPTALQPKPWHFTAEVSLELEVLGTTFLIEDRVLSPLLEPGCDLAIDRPVDEDALLSSGLYAGFRAHNQISFGLRLWPLLLLAQRGLHAREQRAQRLGWGWVSNAPDGRDRDRLHAAVLIPGDQANSSSWRTSTGQSPFSASGGIGLADHGEQPPCSHASLIECASTASVPPMAWRAS